MANLRSILYTPHRSSVSAGAIEWARVKNSKVIVGLPQIVWRDSTPWREVNLWAQERATCGDVDLKTVHSNMTSMLMYANWLEETGNKWWDFPPKKADRCLVRFRGALITARDEGTLAPSTVSQHMRNVVRCYRWLRSSRLLSPEWPMWRERIIGIQLTNSIGLERTMMVQSTDLAIKNRRVQGERLEDGLLPVSLEDRDVILKFTRDNSCIEMFLLLALGFYTGMRIGTLTDLKVRTLEQAVPWPLSPELFQIAVGPGADPPVATKFGVTGQVSITKVLLDTVLEYAYSIRRLKREAKASPLNKELVFLTRFGNPYAQRGSERSPAVNVLLHMLRKSGVSCKTKALRDFYFHQSRCTFGTELARIAIQTAGPINAIAFVKDALLHKNEATAMKYIKFVKSTPTKEALANAFTADFLGILTSQSGALFGQPPSA